MNSEGVHVGYGKYGRCLYREARCGYHHILLYACMNYQRKNSTKLLFDGPLGIVLRASVIFWVVIVLKKTLS